jgi:hypothetical protein
MASAAITARAPPKTLEKVAPIMLNVLNVKLMYATAYYLFFYMQILGQNEIIA